jgi:lambda family phage portal protein
MEPKANILDKFINFFNPKAGYERISWRNSYNAGDTGRLNGGWGVTSQYAEQKMQASRDNIRARARHAEDNSDIAEGIIGALERNVVGTGIKLQAKVVNNKGQEDEILNQEIERLWKIWTRAKNCDVTGQQSFVEMQAMAIRRIIVDGGVIFIKNIIDGQFVLQIRSVDNLDSSYNTVPQASKNRIINGVELNKYNKPVAYYIKTVGPDGYWDGKSEAIKADRVMFLYRKKLPSQIREISELTKTLKRLNDVDNYIEAVGVKERILACLSVFIKKMTPGGIGRGTVDTTTNYAQTKLAPGMITHLNPGDEVQTVNPSGQSSDTAKMIQTQQRLSGAGQGLSYESTSRDYSQTNYSSARQGLIEDQTTFRMWQNFLKEHLLIEVYESFLENAILQGKIRLLNYFANKEKYLNHEWQMPGWAWIDPLKEAKANELALNTGQTTLAIIAAGRGLDWRDLAQQRAKEKEYMEALGLSLNGDNNNEQTEQILENDGEDGKQKR